MDRIPVAGPSITQLEIDYVTNAWYGSANTYHARFESAFVSYVGRKVAMALPSATSARHLSLLALGVGPGDEVIIPDSTWIASAAPITYVSATPVVVDVDDATQCIRPDSFEAAITSRTKAVILVDSKATCRQWTSCSPSRARVGSTMRRGRWVGVLWAACRRRHA